MSPTQQRSCTKNLTPSETCYDARFAVEERAVPRSGVIVTRSFQYAHTASDGSVLWLGRRKRVGRGEGVSDLRYDILERAMPRWPVPSKYGEQCCEH